MTADRHVAPRNAHAWMADDGQMHDAHDSEPHDALHDAMIDGDHADYDDDAEKHELRRGLQTQRPKLRREMMRRLRAIFPGDAGNEAFRI